MERLFDSMVDKGLSNNHDAIALKSFQKKIKEFKVDPRKTFNQVGS